MSYAAPGRAGRAGRARARYGAAAAALQDEANARERRLLDRTAHEHARLELPLGHGIRRFAAEQRFVRRVRHDDVACLTIGADRELDVHPAFDAALGGAL